MADEAGEPEEDGPMGGGAVRDAHSADGRGGDPGDVSRARPAFKDERRCAAGAEARNG